MSVYQTDILTDREADIIIVIKFYFIWRRNIPSDTNAEGISKYKLIIKNHIARHAFKQRDKQAGREGGRYRCRLAYDRRNACKASRPRVVVLPMRIAIV